MLARKSAYACHLVLQAGHLPQSTSVLASCCLSRRASQAHVSILAISSSSCMFISSLLGRKSSHYNMQRILPQIHQVRMPVSVRIFCPTYNFKEQIHHIENISHLVTQKQSRQLTHVQLSSSHLIRFSYVSVRSLRKFHTAMIYGRLLA